MASFGQNNNYMYLVQIQTLYQINIDGVNKNL